MIIEADKINLDNFLKFFTLDADTTNEFNKISLPNKDFLLIAALLKLELNVRRIK